MAITPPSVNIKILKGGLNAMMSMSEKFLKSILRQNMHISFFTIGIDYFSKYFHFYFYSK